MEAVFQDMITALRSAGLRISISESLDALRALRLTGYGDKQVLKDALSATLAKSQLEKETFDVAFERFFSLDDFSAKQSEAPSSPVIGAGGEEAPLTQMLLAGDGTGLSLSMRAAAQAADVKGIRFFTQKSLYIQRILKGMGGEGLEHDIRRLSGAEDPWSQQRARALQEAKRRLFEGVRDFVERQFSLFAAAATEEIIEKYLRGMRLSNLEQRDFYRMRSIIQRMVKRLNTLHSRRRKTARQGCIDFKKTVRENIAYQGVLFSPRWKARRIDRPDIVAICDISRSVAAVARFMLLFLYSLSETVARIRSFVFCSNLVEASHVFEAYPVEEALERLLKGAGLGVILGRTDYGQALEDFKDNFLGGVSRKTTVIILGDGRNNYGDPRRDILQLIAERSKALIWLNPEPPSFWGTGDSEMKRYLPACYLVRECNTTNHLERLVGLLLRTVG